MKKELMTLISIMVLFLIFSCKKAPLQTSITLFPAGLPDSVGGTLIPTASLTLEVGQTDTIRTALLPSKAPGGIAWSSSDPAIVSVDRAGVVTGIVAGSALITATMADGNKTATCTVTVSRWVTYDQPEGIVYAIAIDAQGNKWFGLAGLFGVAKFDGANWTTYSSANSGLAEDYVPTLVIDGQGNIWCGTNNAGVSEFDGTNWTTYNVANSGIASNHINAIAVDAQGNKWFGTDHGISEFDGVHWSSKITSSFVAVITIDAQGNIWFGADDGVWKFDGATTALLYGFNPASSIIGTKILAITIDAQGNKWIGTDYGVSKYDGTKWTTYNTTYSGIAGGGVYAIAIDAQGNKWFASDGGISKFDDTHWTIYNAKAGPFIFGTSFLSLAVDAQGNKWCGSLGVVELYAQ